MYTNNVHIEIKVIFEYHVIKVKFKQQLLQALQMPEPQRFQKLVSLLVTNPKLEIHACSNPSP
jgi:hypothetical protein